VSAGDSIGIAVIGTQIRMMYKPSAGAWTQILSTTDGNISGSGRIGMHTEENAVGTLDDFGGGTVGSGQTLMSNTGTVTNSTGRVKYRLSAGSAQAAGTYTNLITYIITGTY